MVLGKRDRIRPAPACTFVDRHSSGDRCWYHTRSLTTGERTNLHQQRQRAHGSAAGTEGIRAGPFLDSVRIGGGGCRVEFAINRTALRIRRREQLHAAIVDREYRRVV